MEPEQLSTEFISSIIIAPTDKVNAEHDVNGLFGRWMVYKGGKIVGGIKGNGLAFNREMEKINKDPQKYIDQYEAK